MEVPRGILPDGTVEQGEPTQPFGRGLRVWKLNKAIYGTRDAAQIWVEFFGGLLTRMNFAASRLAPGVFHHAELKLALVVHVDDVLFSGPREALSWVLTQLRRDLKVEGQILHPSSGTARAHRPGWGSR